MATALTPSWTFSSEVVGRSYEIDRLEAGLLAALAGTRACVLLTGDPGIGKTRLAREIAERAGQAGARVCWGRAWEAGGAPDYWPWVQIVRALVADAEGASLLAAEPPARRERLARIVPETSAPGSPVRPAPESEPEESARFRLFEAVTGLVRRVAETRPLVLVIDDLHAADASSLLLLRFLLRDESATRVLVVGTYRTVEAEREPARARLLADVAREGETLVLAPLDEAEVGRLAEQLLGTSPPAELVQIVHAWSEGNPLLAGEAVRLVATRGGGTALALDAVPARLPSLVRERLEGMSQPCREVLTVAAVIGREFDLADLGDATGMPAAELLTLLGEADANGVVRAGARDTGLYGFTHGLLREALYVDIAPARRVRLHRSVGEALARRFGDDPARTAELARHFVAATAGGDAAVTAQAVAYARRAGDESQRRYAHAEAAAHYERALALVPASTPATERAELLLALGLARTQAGDGREARAAFREAADLARRSDDVEQLGRAAVGMAGRGDVHVRFDREVVDLLEEALRRLPVEDGVLRARLLARLARVLYYSGPRERVRAAAAEGLAIARRLGQTWLLANALDAQHFALWEPAPTAPKLAVANELVACAQSAGLRESEAAGHCWRFADLLERGDLPAALRALDAYVELATELRQPFFLWRAAVHRTALALLQGRFADAEAASAEAMTLGARLSSRTPALIAGIHHYLVRREQGRLDELEPMLRAMAEQNATMPAFRAALAHFFAEAGRRDEARAELDAVALGGLSSFPRDANWLSMMGELAAVATFVGDTARAAELYEQLVPFADQVIVTGVADVCEGSVARHLGTLAATLGRFEDAERHFARAAALDTALGARPYVARGGLEHAYMLAARGAPGDTLAATRLAAEAAALAETLGMTRVAAMAQALVAALAVRTAEGNVFRRDGRTWTVRFADVAAEAKHCKGFEYLAHLLAEPGREWHALDLATTARGVPAGRSLGTRQLADERLDVRGLGDAGLVLDARGKSAYRARLTELRAELAEAENAGDEARAGSARAELEQLEHALAAAYGLGGRDTRTGSAAERARVAVTKAIRQAIAGLVPLHPALAEHLDRSVRTGRFFSYRSAEPVAWRT